MRILLIRQTSKYSLSVLGNGVGIIATILDSAGHDVKVIDNNTLYKRYSSSDLVREVERYQPDIVAFSLTMLNAHSTYKLAALIRTKFEHIPLIAGGIHMKYSSDEALRHGIDVVVKREGEQVILPLIEHISKNYNDIKNGLESVAGITFIKGNGELFVSDRFPVLADLDEVPIVNFNLFNIHDYVKTGNEPGIIYVVGQRGCPFTCTFCSDEIQRQDKRSASGDWLFANVKDAYTQYGIRHIAIADNNFALPKQRAYDFCSRLIDSGLSKKISFSCMTEIWTPLNEELLALMKKAGCNKIYVGLERLVPYSQEMIKKKSSLSRIHEIFSMIRKNNIEVAVDTLWGFPFESIDLIRQERESFRQLRRYTMNFNPAILQPSPGTIYYDEYPKAKEWYLNPFSCQMRRAYFVTNTHGDMLDQLDLNHFDLPANVRNEIRELYLDYTKMAYGHYLSHKGLGIQILKIVDSALSRISRWFFSFSPRLEYFIFSKISALRYYVGTLILGKKVS